MWIPRPYAMDEAELRPLVDEVGSAELITVGADSFPIATRLPIIWREGRLIFHMAAANPQWRTIGEATPALAVVTGPEAYITPSWYTEKEEHGRVAPTWNYSAVHFRGRATVHRDPDWVRAAVSDLSDLHERRRDRPWSIEDAPRSYVDQQMAAIVGVELAIESIEAKAKRSQNQSHANRVTVIENLDPGGYRGERRMAQQMSADLGTE